MTARFRDRRCYLVAVAGLSRPACAGEFYRARDRIGDQPAAGAVFSAATIFARRGAGYRQHRTDNLRPRLLALFYPLLLGAAALTDALPRLRFSALGFLPSVLALALYSMPPVLRNTITGIDSVDPDLAVGGARRRRRPTGTAVHGGIAARHAGDHGRHPHRRRMGDRHRYAIDADRPDQPTQLHLQRPADAELDFGAVRLRGAAAAGVGGRSVAGADGARRRIRRAHP